MHILPRSQRKKQEPETQTKMLYSATCTNVMNECLCCNVTTWLLWQEGRTKNIKFQNLNS